MHAFRRGYQKKNLFEFGSCVGWARSSCGKWGGLQIWEETGNLFFLFFFKKKKVNTRAQYNHLTAIVACIHQFLFRNGSTLVLVTSAKHLGLLVFNSLGIGVELRNNLFFLFIFVITKKKPTFAIRAVPFRPLCCLWFPWRDRDGGTGGGRIFFFEFLKSKIFLRIAYAVNRP